MCLAKPRVSGLHRQSTQPLTGRESREDTELGGGQQVRGMRASVGAGAWACDAGI